MLSSVRRSDRRLMVGMMMDKFTKHTYPSGQGSGLQNRYSPVRIRPCAPSWRRRSQDDAPRPLHEDTPSSTATRARSWSESRPDEKELKRSEGR